MVQKILVFVLLGFVCILTMAHTHSAMAKATAASPEARLASPVSSERIQELFKHAQANNYSTRYGIFADFQHNSGKERLFVVDFSNNAVLERALVTHGHCREDEQAIRFSNIADTNCSSEGKYSIGKSYYGIFGLAYKLHGLDKTNSNAFARHIVLHAHECVYDQTWPTEICESEGCPTVSPKVLQKLKKMIEGETKPILLWVYKSSKQH